MLGHDAQLGSGQSIVKEFNSDLDSPTNDHYKHLLNLWPRPSSSTQRSVQLKKFFVRDGILSVADYNSTLMGVVVVVVMGVCVGVGVSDFTMG